MLEIEVRKAQEVPGIYSCFLKFSQFNENWIGVIRQFNCRKYNKETHEWEFPFYSLNEIVERYRSLPITIHYKKEKEYNNFIPVPELELKRQLFTHQKVAVEYGVNNPKYLLLDSMGIGKTTSVIATALALKKLGKIKQCLIICCISDLQYNWEKEIKVVCDEECYILGSRYRKNGKRYAGSVNDRIDDLKSHKEFFLITNKETLQNDEFIKLLRHEYKKFPINIDFLAIDEFHKGCSNPSAISGKNIQKLCKIPYIIPMTGTPLRNRPMDLWSPLTLIGKEHSTYSLFEAYYGIRGEYNQVIEYRNLDALQHQLSQCSLRRTKEEVLPDLPEKIYENVYVTMNDRQKKIYEEMYQLALENIDKIEESPNPLAQLIRLRQATGYTGILSTTIKESAKMDRIEQDVDEIIENGEKVLIYSNWTDMTDELERRLSKKYPVLSITGKSASGDKVEEIKDKFQNNPEYRILIGTTGKMGTGHTLTAATWVLFLDEPWTDADKRQAVDRTHRPGQKHTVNIRTYLTRDTIDEQVNAIVESKGNMADFVVDGKQDRKSLTKFLLNIE